MEMIGFWVLCLPLVIFSFVYGGIFGIISGCFLCVLFVIVITGQILEKSDNAKQRARAEQEFKAREERKKWRH